MNKKLLRILGKRGRITIPFEIRQRVGFLIMTCCLLPRVKIVGRWLSVGKSSAMTVRVRLYEL